jgi:hypothetical protein
LMGWQNSCRKETLLYLLSPSPLPSSSSVLSSSPFFFLLSLFFPTLLYKTLGWSHFFIVTCYWILDKPSAERCCSGVRLLGLDLKYLPLSLSTSPNVENAAFRWKIYGSPRQVFPLENRKLDLWWLWVNSLRIKMQLIEIETRCKQSWIQGTTLPLVLFFSRSVMEVFSVPQLIEDCH